MSLISVTDLMVYPQTALLKVTQKIRLSVRVGILERRNGLILHTGYHTVHCVQVGGEISDQPVASLMYMEDTMPEHNTIIHRQYLLITELFPIPIFYRKRKINQTSDLTLVYSMEKLKPRSMRITDRSITRLWV